jgi:hypothetical protein
LIQQAQKKKWPLLISCGLAYMQHRIILKLLFCYLCSDSLLRGDLEHLLAFWTI